MNKNICPLCKERYDFSCSIRIDEKGNKTCSHDTVSEKGYSLSNHEKKLAKDLPKNRQMVKGKDGVARVIEQNK